MAVMQCGPGFAYTRDLSALTTTRQKFPIAMLKKAKITGKPKQEFASGSNQVDSFSANVKLDWEGELEFEALEVAQLNHMFFAQYLIGGTLALSKLLQIDDPKTITTNAITLTNGESVLDVRTPVALNSGAIPAGAPLKRIASGTPTTGFYTVSGEGTATVTITFAAADATAIGAATVPVTWVKKATTDANQIVVGNAIVQQSIYFGLELATKFNGQDKILNAARVVCAEPPDIYDASDKFSAPKLKVKLLADPLTGRVFDFTGSEGSA